MQNRPVATAHGGDDDFADNPPHIANAVPNGNGESFQQFQKVLGDDNGTVNAVDRHAHPLTQRDGTTKNTVRFAYNPLNKDRKQNNRPVGLFRRSQSTKTVIKNDRETTAPKNGRRASAITSPTWQSSAAVIRHKRCSISDSAAEVELDTTSGLERLLIKALIQSGVSRDECPKKAVAIMDSLAELYVRTPDQLKDALEIPEVLEQVAGCLRGMLLPAVRAQLKNRASDRSRWMKLVSGGDSQKPEPPDKEASLLNEPLCRTLQVARVDVTHLAEIDQISQTFYARLFLILRIEDGANDPDLTSDYEGFPFDQDGRPTFRPSGLWYLNQIDFPNGKEVRVVESKVTKAGDDLQLIKRIEGTFFVPFALQSFPFDEQDLTVTVSANCACEGPVPVEFRVDPLSQLGVDVTNFPHGDIWDLSPTLTTSLATVGASSARRFPAVHLQAKVRRQCGFVLVNAAVPVSAISFLSLTTFFVPPEDTADRLELSITILLTAVAFKYTTSSYLPQISYMTLVDKFATSCAGIIVAVCLGHTALGTLDRWVGASPEVLDVVNKAFLVGIFLVWVAVQLWFLYNGKRERRVSFRGEAQEWLKKQSGSRRLLADS